MEKIKGLFKKYKAPILYFFISCFVLVIDTGIVFIITHMAPLGPDGLVDGTTLMIANVIGNIVGFVVHYLLSSKQVFDTKLGLPGFIVYLATFLFGIVLAAAILWFFMKPLALETYGDLGLLISKGFSVAIPFFILYFIRKYAFNMIRKKGKKKSE